MTMHAPLVDGMIAAASAASLGIIGIAQELPLEAKDVSLLAIVTAIGVWMVRTVDKWGDRTTTAIEKGIEAHGQVAKAMALLMAETNEARRDLSEQRSHLISAIDAVPVRVAEQINRGRTP